MSASAASSPSPLLFTLSDNDASLTITLPLEVFVAGILITFMLGSCIGFVLGKYQHLKDTSSRLDAKDSNQQWPNEPSCNKTNGENGNRQDSFNCETKKDGEEKGDGPTMVLRGSLDLMASKWGVLEATQDATIPYSQRNADTGRRSDKGSRGADNPMSTANSSCWPSSSAVVEYLSPEEMTQLLFSNIHRDGCSISETLCLDEYQDNSEDRIEEQVPSPKSSAVDKTTILPSSKNSDSNKTSQEEAASISPPAFVNLLSLIQKYSVDTSHPYFFNQLFGSLDPIALAAEIVALSVNTSVYTYETAPVFTLLEREVMGQIGRLVFHKGEKENDVDGDEEEFKGEGLMIPGGSLANLTAMHSARHRWKVMNGHTIKAQSQSPAFDDDAVRLMDMEDMHEEERQQYWSSSSIDDVEEEKKFEDVSTFGTTALAAEEQQMNSNLYDDNQFTPDLVAFVSSEAHYSFSKSARVLGLLEDDLIVIPTHSDGRMDASALAKKIEELELLEQTSLDTVTAAGEPTRTARKRVPFFVACTAGSTVRGSFDDIAEIVKVCRAYESRGASRGLASNSDNHNHHYERSIWVHVDGAWGGSAIFSSRPAIRRITHADDIRHADSFTFNPHKMLGAPQQTTAFIVRHRHALRDANAAGAKYLFDPRKNGAEYDLGDLSYTCGRRTDAVKLWALWKYYGRSGLGRRVDQKVDELEMFVEEIRKRGREEKSFALACKPWLFNVNFFYFPPRIRRILEKRGITTTQNNVVESGDGIAGAMDDDDFIQIPDDIAQDLANVSVLLKLRLHEAGEMIIPYQPLNNQKADCFRLVLAGKKDFSFKDICHILDTMEKYGADL
mmetsp:Transcript_11599/g.24742  ORF Transcript_11599/g.24742 Transcript_11599/m.24742 type:complete len:841 (+) Transcript_11599:173-2695(+)